MKLIVIDLDGILLNKESVIFVENRVVIKWVVDVGIFVIICMGRVIFDVKVLLEDLDIFIIVVNGGMVYDKGYCLISWILMD